MGHSLNRNFSSNAVYSSKIIAQQRGKNDHMETYWDWLTVIAFAGLATLLLQRSSEEEPRDELWHYAPPAVGCAVTNYLGNEGQHLIAAVLFVGVIAYIVMILKVRLPKL